MEEPKDVTALTYGEKAVGKSFNPSQLKEVENIKRDAAHLIDTFNTYRSESDDPEVKRMYSVAITELQTAQMWAVKAATWGK